MKFKDAALSQGILKSLEHESQKNRMEELHPKKDSLSSATKVTIKATRKGGPGPSTEEAKRQKAMRRLWNSTMPALNCSHCAFSTQCPQFKSGYECAFLPFINSHKIETEEDLIFYAKEMCAENVKRSQIMLIMERLSGAQPTVETSEALSHTFQQLMLLHERLTDKNSLTVEVESTDQSVVGRLFGNLDSLLGNVRDAHMNPIDSPNSLAEQSLDTTPQASGNELKQGNEDLMSEFAIVGAARNPITAPLVDLRSMPVAVSHKKGTPIEEEL